MTGPRGESRPNYPRWIKIKVRGEDVVLSFGTVEKPMSADAAVRLAMELIAAARGCDVNRGMRWAVQASDHRAEADLSHDEG